MRQANIKSFDISVEEFDSMNGEHVFSDRYNKRKAAILKKYKKRVGSSGADILKAAAVLIILVIGVPVGVNAATNGEFFRSIWGNLGKENVSSHEEVYVEESKGTEIIETYPQIEYEDVDPEKAQELIGEKVSYPAVKETMGDTTIEILSVVYDGNAIVAEYVLEREGGVNCFDYGQLRNEAKGALLKEDVPYRFWFEEGSGKIFVDMSRSTDDRLYCYEYMADRYSSFGPDSEMLGFEPVTDHISLYIEEFSKPVSEFIDSEEDYRKYLTDSRLVPVAVNEKAKITCFTDGEGRSLEVSPISIKTPSVYAGNDEDELMEEHFVYYINIKYKDGSEYLVMDENIPGEPERCSVEKANYQYIVVGLDGSYILLFNRLVDTDNIESITVNDEVYSAR